MTSAKYIRFHETISVSVSQDPYMKKMCTCTFSILHSIHVWNSYLHLVVFNGKVWFSYIPVPWMVRDCYVISYNGKSPATQLTGHHASSAVLSLCREYSTPKGRQGPRKTVDPWFFFWDGDLSHDATNKRPFRPRNP